jgi:hypothetical protein
VAPRWELVASFCSCSVAGPFGCDATAALRPALTNGRSTTRFLGITKEPEGPHLLRGLNRPGAVSPGDRHGGPPARDGPWASRRAAPLGFCREPAQEMEKNPTRVRRERELLAATQRLDSGRRWRPRIKTLLVPARTAAGACLWAVCGTVGSLWHEDARTSRVGSLWHEDARWGSVCPMCGRRIEETTRQREASAGRWARAHQELSSRYTERRGRGP